MLSAALAIFSSVASAGPIVACSSQTTWTIVQLELLNLGGCQQGGLLFLGFGGTIPATDSVQFSSSGSTFTVTMGNPTGLTGTFAASYAVEVDESQFLFQAYITQAEANIVDPGSGNGMLALIIDGVTGTALATDVSGTITPGYLTGFSAVSVDVSETFDPPGSTIVSISNTFTVSAPEPISLLLFGSGLLCVLLIGGRKLAPK